MTRFFKMAIAGFSAGILLAGPLFASAAVYSANEVVEVTAPVADDVFLAGERVTVREPIADDAFIAGSTLEILNTIGEDLFAAGDTVTITADVKDDAFLAGDLVTLTDMSVGDVFAAGRSVELRSGTTVDGDVRVAGATVMINASITGNVYAASERVEIGPEAKITGDVVVYGRQEPIVADSAEITGSIRRVTESGRERAGMRSHIAGWVRNVLALFIAALVALYLIPKLSRTVTDQAPRVALLSFVTGLIWLILTVPVVVALFLTVVGWPLALVVVTLTLLVLFLSICLMPLVVGAWLHRRWISKNNDAPLQWQHALLGAVIVAIAGWIPIIGPLLIAVLTLIVVGTLLRTFRSYV